MDRLSGFWNDLKNVIASMTPVDGLDILMLSIIIYALMKWVKETRAEQLVKGIAVLGVAYGIAAILEMKAITFLLSRTFDIGLLALLIMFQPELRRALEKVGHTKVGQLGVFQLGSEMSDETVAKWNTAIEAICDACDDLSATTTGALIVIERQTKLGEQIDTGTIMNAVPSKEVFGNIFYPKTPLHDGAVIMRDGIILAAACFLPKPQKEELINKQLGSRHRAAIGMSENSDAVVVVVSEETGCISVAENGSLTRNLTRDSLKKLLRTKLLPEKPQQKTEKKLNFRRLFK
ncbi:MAG: diadenylate cyclase CdaA [Oscillospiraceae bacterium]|nr:diadenylate cyclase CdaA [Oscillospiraceae bacterium]